MRKLIVSELVTLDGVMEAPGGEEGHPHTGWVLDFMGPEQKRYKLEEVLESEALLLGRVTYVVLGSGRRLSPRRTRRPS
jgi:hypothetical protein